MAPVEPFSLNEAVKLWRNVRYAVALTGAGISTPSGIPDFRSARGLWQSDDALAAASLSGLRHQPDRFFNWFRDLAETILTAEPNPAHQALVSLEQSGNLQAIVTQNIDLLHSRAGSSTVYEVHGHLRTATCLDCGQQEGGEPLLRLYLANGITPRCKLCGGTIKPDVILFGEDLPAAVFAAARNVIRQCDLLLVAGSSLAVWPVNELPYLAKRGGARLIIVNQEPTECDRLADLRVRQDVAIFLPALAMAVQQGGD